MRIDRQNEKRKPALARGAVLCVAAWLAAGLAGCGNGDQNGAIRVSGNIEVTEVAIAFKLSGKLVERAVDEGDRVEAGQVIARLDREQLDRQLEEARAGLAAAESQLVLLRTAIDYQREALHGQIAEREAQLRQARAQLAELEAGSRAREIERARARVAEAETQFVQASADWKRAVTLIKGDDISRAQYDQFRARHEAARAQLSQAKDTLALVVEGPRKETIEQARARVSQAEAALRLARAQRLELKRKEQEVQTRRAGIEQAKARQALIESHIADTVAYSPVDGVVLSKAAEVGEVLAAGATVVTVGDLRRPWVRAFINERDLGRVKIGSPVVITTDSFPGKHYDGRVTFIASDAEFTPKQIQTEEERVKLVYRIKIDVANPEQELKVNMPVDGVISVAQ